MNLTSQSLIKLKIDFNRYCVDQNIKGHFKYFKMLLIVDFYPVAYYRFIEYCREKSSPLRTLLKSILVLVKPIVNGMSGARISPTATIGGGILLHQSAGVVIASGSVIGNNCTFFSGACVVYKANFEGSAAPVIGDNVKLMVGSKVIGNVHVGNDAFIGANAVVISDVPAFSIAVGIPASIKPRRDVPVSTG